MPGCSGVHELDRKVCLHPGFTLSSQVDRGCAHDKNIMVRVWSSLSGGGICKKPSDKKPLLTHGSPFVSLSL